MILSKCKVKKRKEEKSEKEEREERMREIAQRKEKERMYEGEREGEGEGAKQRERRLKVIATKGVVTLFNSVNAFQNQKRKEQRVEGLLGEWVSHFREEGAPEETRSLRAVATSDSDRQDTASKRRDSRSEERRVGKECRSRWSPYH